MQASQPERRRARPRANSDSSFQAAEAAAVSMLEGQEVALRELLRALQAMRDGDFSVRLPGDQVGLTGKIADTFNEIVAANEHLARELERAGRRPFSRCLPSSITSWGQATVLIALTGWGQDEDRRRSREVGFDSHLVKPLDPDTLFRMLASLPVARPAKAG